MESLELNLSKVTLLSEDNSKIQEDSSVIGLGTKQEKLYVIRDFM